MNATNQRSYLLLSLQRALLGAVHPQLRQASVEVNVEQQLLRLRFEYDGQPQELAQESCSQAATEVLADMAGLWQLEEEHLARPAPLPLVPLAFTGYLRWEPDEDER